MECEDCSSPITDGVECEVCEENDKKKENERQRLKILYFLKRTIEKDIKLRGMGDIKVTINM